MSTATKIEWATDTWNPVTGCTRVSAGCDHCYAVGMTHRMERMGHVEKYGGLTVLNNKGDRHFNGKVRCHEDALTIPIKWKKPRRIFVNSMSDLFHKEVPFEFIDRVFAVMALCPQHTFQVLTKRPERLAEYLASRTPKIAGHVLPPEWLEVMNCDRGGPATNWTTVYGKRNTRRGQWPLPNVWLGTSCENQEAADERIPHLLRCPAAVRFVSAEPLLGAISFRWAKWHNYETQVRERRASGARVFASHLDGMEGIHWLIVGGESGKEARPCNIEWIRSIVKQCKSAGVPVFCKQLGRFPFDYALMQWPKGTRFSQFVRPRLADPKGGDMNEWPEELRVREFPAVEGCVA